MRSPVGTFAVDFRSLLYAGGSSNDGRAVVFVRLGDAGETAPKRLLDRYPVRLPVRPVGTGEDEVARLSGLGTGKDEEADREVRPVGTGRVFRYEDGDVRE